MMESSGVELPWLTTALFTVLQSAVVVASSRLIPIPIELDSNLLPERGEHVYDDMWRSCAAALDGWMHLIHAVLC